MVPIQKLVPPPPISAGKLHRLGLDSRRQRLIRENWNFDLRLQRPEKVAGLHFQVPLEPFQAGV